MGTNLTWNIAFKGFGLFKDQLNAELKLSASKVAVYAGNGQGKTCISRLFRAADQDCATAVSDTMINRAGSTGEFEFSFSGKDTSGKLHISKTHGDDPTIENDTGYLFHVFNTDYVRDNLQSQHYSINGDAFWLFGSLCGWVVASPPRRRRNSVHRSVEMASPRRFGAFVYTVAPREDRSSDRGDSQECTQIGQNGPS